MRTVSEIEAAVDKLSPQESRAFAAWFAQRQALLNAAEASCGDRSAHASGYDRAVCGGGRGATWRWECSHRDLAAHFWILALSGVMVFSFPVSTLVEIEEAIAKLPAAEFRVLLERLKERDAEAWDRQIEVDAENGRLDTLYARLTQGDSSEGKVSLDEVLDDPKLS